MSSFEALANSVIEGNSDKAESEINKALSDGMKPKEILNDGLIHGMNIVGKRFAAGDMFLPEVIASANTIHKGLETLKPLLADSGFDAPGKILIGTVAGDVHDIGKKIVIFLLQGHGFEVIDLGVDVSNEAFAEAIMKYHPDVLGMSALLTTTMPNMAKVIDLLNEKGIRVGLKIIIGGACVTENYAKSIGADGYALDAHAGVEWITQAINKK